LERLTKLAQ